MPNTAKGTPYVQSSDLVSAYPTVSLSLANHIDNNVAYNAVTYNNQVGTTYTFVLADASTGRIVTASNAAAQTYTVPPQTSVSWATGARIFVTNIGTGALSIAAGAGVTVSNTSAAISQWESVELIRTASDVWAVVRGGLPTVSYANPGMAFITSATFSSSTAVNVNNCFSSTYDTYQIRLSFTSSVVSDNISMRLRVGGTDTVGTGYTWQRFIAGGTTSAAVVGAGVGLWQVGGMDSGSRNTLRIDVFDPSATVPTTFQGQNQNGLSTGQIRLTGGFHTGATAFDGFSLIPDAGNITGTLRVYGMRNS